MRRPQSRKTGHSGAACGIEQTGAGAMAHPSVGSLMNRRDDERIFRAQSIQCVDAHADAEHHAMYADTQNISDCRVAVRRQESCFNGIR
jgi:hypothetical protein